MNAHHIAFLESTGAYVQTQAFRIEYGDYQYKRLVRVDTSAYEFAKTILHYSMDNYGQAQFLAVDPDDFPFVDMTRNQHEVTVHTAGIGYRYSYEEIGLALQLGQNPSAEGAMTARANYEEMIDRVFLNGSPQMGWDSFLNHSQIPRANAPRRTAASTQWVDKGGDEIVADINDAITGTWLDTLQVRAADTIVLPPNHYNLIATKRLSPDVNVTILEYLMRANTYTAQSGGMPLNIQYCRGLETAGENGTARMIAYQNNMDVLRFHLPMPLRWLPMQMRNAHYCYPGIFRMGGLEIRLPIACRYMDGI